MTSPLGRVIGLLKAPSVNATGVWPVAQSTADAVEAVAIESGNTNDRKRIKLPRLVRILVPHIQAAARITDSTRSILSTTIGRNGADLAAPDSLPPRMTGIYEGSRK